MANPLDPRPSGQDGGGQPGGDSCNFAGASGVGEGNDEPSVQSSPAGVTAAHDFTAFMRRHQDRVFSTAARLTGNHAQAVARHASLLGISSHPCK